jgi:hypothetical protein
MRQRKRNPRCRLGSQPYAEGREKQVPQFVRDDNSLFFVVIGLWNGGLGP